MEPIPTPCQTAEPMYSGRNQPGSMKKLVVFAADVRHDSIDDAVVREELLYHADDDHGGDEMGQVADRLHDPLVGGQTQFVEQQRQHDRRPESPQDGQEPQEHRVPDEAHGVRAGEKRLEIVQPDPGASPDSLHHIEALEGDLHPVHRDVLEHHDHPHADGGHQVQALLAREVVDYLRQPAAARGCERDRAVSPHGAAPSGQGALRASSWTPACRGGTLGAKFSQRECTAH